MRKKIEDGTLGLLTPEPLWKGGPDLHSFLPVYDTFALMPWLVKPYSRKQLTREERIEITGTQDTGGLLENAFGILAAWVLLGTMEQRPKVIIDITLTCVVLHNMLRTHQGGADRALTQAALQNEQVVVYVPDENYRNPSSEAKYQQDVLKDFFNHLGALSGQEDRF